MRPDQWPSDLTVQDVARSTGGFSGWHSHPGITVVVVASGEVTISREKVTGGKCRVQTYKTGDVFVEFPGDENQANNYGTVPVVVAVTFFNVPHLGSTRIDRTAPLNCPAP